MLKVTPREALRLVSQTRVLPLELATLEAESVRESLRSQGLEVSLVDVPPTTSRCGVHPALTGDRACDVCQRLVCPLCAPLCPECERRAASAARWKRLRVAVLLTILIGVAGFGVVRQHQRDRRAEWSRPLRVSVTLVAPQPPDPAVLAAWQAGLSDLDAWFTAEAERHALPLPAPVHFDLAPVAVEAEVSLPPEAASGGWLRDSQAALELRSELKALADRGRAKGRFDVQLVVALRNDGAHRVEGLGEAGGSIGLVDGTIADTAVSLELVALAHELLHCLGAKDAYDEQGHALPRGLVDPEAGYPQQFAEVMVGEVPLAPGKGRVPKSLDEVRIGAATAKEIGW